jgi:hypothetical protein
MRIPILFALLLTLVGCTALESATNYQSIILDDTILNQCTRDVPSIEGAWNPSLKLAKQIEIDLPQLNGTTAEKLPGAEDWVLDVSGYTYQYAGVIVDGKELVYINAFHNAHKVSQDNWQIWRVDVCYGFTNYWGALYDPKSRTFSDWTHNVAATPRPAIKLRGRRNVEAM